jgi:hypothetical protein
LLDTRFDLIDRECVHSLLKGTRQRNYTVGGSR